MFNYYEEQPASPPVEWFRYANRRAKDLLDFPKRLRDQVASTLAIFGLAWILVGPDEALDRLVTLIVAALASVIVVPVTKWTFHFATAFHVLLKEENERLLKDNTALSDTLAGARQELEECRKTAATAPELKVEVQPERLVVQDHPPSAVISKVEPFTDAVRKEGTRKLAQLRERAITELLNRRVRNPDELEVLKRDITAWEREVVSMLEQYSGVNETTTFRVLGSYTARVTGGINVEHNRELAMLWERIKRLEKVLERLSS